jgi:hypothetical protein
MSLQMGAQQRLTEECEGVIGRLAEWLCLWFTQSAIFCDSQKTFGSILRPMDLGSAERWISKPQYYIAYKARFGRPWKSYFCACVSPLGWSSAKYYAAYGPVKWWLQYICMWLFCKWLPCRAVRNRVNPRSKMTPLPVAGWKWMNFERWAENWDFDAILTP